MEALVDHLFRALAGAPQPLPLYGSAVQAGFPSPADDHIERVLDLNDLLIENPPATFYVRARGDSMEDAGIRDGDLLVVDRSLTPRSGAVVIAAIDGELLVKSLWIGEHGHGELRAANARYQPIPLGPDRDCLIWGVVKAVVRRL
jgi:DNA polymerase V